MPTAPTLPSRSTILIEHAAAETDCTNGTGDDGDDEFGVTSGGNSWGILFSIRASAAAVHAGPILSENIISHSMELIVLLTQGRKNWLRQNLAPQTGPKSTEMSIN